VFKQPEQEMLADSTIDTHHVGGHEVIDVQPSRLPNSPIIMAARAGAARAASFETGRQEPASSG